MKPTNHVTEWREYDDGAGPSYAVRWVGAYKLTAARMYRAAGKYEWWAEVTGLPSARCEGFEHAKRTCERMVRDELARIASLLGAPAPAITLEVGDGEGDEA